MFEYRRQRMELEAKFCKFANAFGLGEKLSFQSFLIYCSSSMRCRVRSEEILVRQMQQAAPAENQRGLQRLLLRIMNYRMNNRLEFLYAIWEVNRQKTFRVYIQQTSGYTPPAYPPKLQIRSSNGPYDDNGGRKVVSIPQERIPTKALIEQLVYALQGRSTEFLNLEISKLTGLYQIVPVGLTPTYTGLLGEISDCCGLYKRLEQILTALEGSKNKIKMAFLEYARDYINGEYLSTLDEMQRYTELLCFVQTVRSKIRPFLLLLTELAESFTYHLGSCEDYLGIAYKARLGTHTELVSRLEAPVVCFLMNFAQFGDVVDTSGDFFIQPYRDEQNPFLAFRNYSYNALFQQFFNIGLNVHFLLKTCRNTSFRMTDSPEFYQLYEGMQAREGVQAQQRTSLAELQRSAGPLLRYVNNAVFAELSARHLDVYLSMVVGVFLGFQGDFLTRFAEEQSTASRLYDSYMLSALNQLAHIVDSSRLARFPKEFLDQIFPVLQREKGGFLLQLRPVTPFNCVFLPAHIQCLTEVFGIILQLRICELAASEKRRFARLQMSMFKVLGLLRTISGYLHGQFMDAVSRLQGHFCAFDEAHGAREAYAGQHDRRDALAGQVERFQGLLTGFCAELSKITLNGRLAPFLVAVSKLMQGVSLSQPATKKAQITARARDFDAQMELQCKELAGALTGVQNGLEDEYELLIGQLSACGFRRG